jgi:hypothetical protein
VITIASYDDVNEVLFGTVGLLVTGISPVKVTATIKQTLGKRIAKHEIPGMDALDWRIQLNGIIYSTGATTKEQIREKLESLQDGKKHDYNDGRIVGSFCVENEGLTFDDSADRVFNHFQFSLSLIEWSGD